MRFFFEYFKWHYTIGVMNLVNIIGNFIWFFYEFFSIPLLLKTFFNPYRRLNETYTKAFNLGKWFETLVINILMRIIGALFRSVLIVLGVLCILLTACIGVFILIVWECAPLCIVFLVLFGLKLLSVN